MLFSALMEFPILAIAAIGFYISLRLLRFPDLGVDAARMAGMSALVVMLRAGFGNELWALPAAMIAGAATGVVTGLLHTSQFLGVNRFLSGMLVALAAYSICFRACGQTPVNLYVHKEQFLWTRVASQPAWLYVSLLILFVGLVWLLAQRLLSTRYGLVMRSAGDRPRLVRVSGLNEKVFIVSGMALANMIVAISGWLSSVINYNVDLKSFDQVIKILAACLMGDFVRHIVFMLMPSRFGRFKTTLAILLLSPVVGAFLLSFIQSVSMQILTTELAMTMGTDLQLVIALCIVGVIFVGRRLGVRDLALEEER